MSCYHIKKSLAKSVDLIIFLSGKITKKMFAMPIQLNNIVVFVI